MEKFLQTLFGTKSLVEVARKIITIIVVVGLSIPAVSGILGERVRGIVKDEMVPVTSYIYGEMVKLIDKNFDKIIKDPGDVKLIDIEACLSYWEILQNENIPGKIMLSEKIDKMKAWYLSRVAGNA